MKQLKLATYLGVFALLAFVMSACNKDIEVTTAPEQAHFALKSFDSYFITGPTVSYPVKIGLTNVSDQDRTVNISVTSPTGAQLGTHYTLSATSLVIPAGKALDSIILQGVYSQYLTGRKDTLIFTITEPGVPASSFNNTFKLLMRGPCFDGDIDATTINDLMGNYNNTFDGTYGPYLTKVLSITPLTATTARVVINNVWDDGYGDINFIADWTDPNNPTMEVDGPQVTPGEAGHLNAAYTGMKVVIRKHANPGSATTDISICNQTIRLVYQLGIYDPSTNTILGYFSNVFTTNMAR